MQKIDEIRFPRTTAFLASLSSEAESSAIIALESKARIWEIRAENASPFADTFGLLRRFFERLA